MRGINTTTNQPCILNAIPFYYGWVIVGLSFLANLTAAGLRSAPSVLIHPLEAEFGWSRTAVASAASLNLLLLGLGCPAGWMAHRPHWTAPRHSRLPNHNCGGTDGNYLRPRALAAHLLVGNRLRYRDRGHAAAGSEHRDPLVR